MRGQTFSQISDGLTIPTLFKVVVILERIRYENPKTFQMEEQNIYASQAIEWDVCASGETIELAVRRLETLIFGHVIIMLEHPGHVPIGPAPEAWQRVATSGDWYEVLDKKWKEFFPVPLKIVHRCVLDMSRSQLRAVDNT